MRLLQEKLRKKFDNKLLFFPKNPEWDIAFGACTVDAAPDDRKKYMLADDIKLSLSNGEPLTLLSKGQPIPTLPAVFHLSTVDCEETAKFVFRTNNRNDTFIPFPILGGEDEVLILSVFVDKYNIFHANVKTNKEDNEYELFIGEKIDLCYDLEG